VRVIEEAEVDWGMNGRKKKKGATSRYETTGIAAKKYDFFMSGK
jgi:hypothetical protein